MIKQLFHKYINKGDFILIGALVVAFTLGWNTITAMQRNYRLQQKYSRLQAEVELQEITNQNLKYQIEYLKTDAYLELAARDKFNKSLPGETLVYLPGSGEAERQAVATQKEVKKIEIKKGWRGNIETWWRFVRGKNA